MTDLVCDYVCLCEVAGRAQALLHYGVEARIDIEFLIPRAIEWADGGGRVAAAASRYAISKHDERGRLVGARRTAVARQCPAFEERRPHVFGRSEDDTGEIARSAIRLRRLPDAGAGRRRRSRVTTHQRSQELLLES